MTQCLAVMYHYVRDPERTDWPGLKARRVEEFRGQVAYLARHHQPLFLRDFERYFHGEADLPENGFYLTFDDGLAEHRDTVTPILEHHGLEGAFFPMLEPQLTGRVPTVTKMQLLVNHVPFETLHHAFFEELRSRFPDLDVTRWQCQGEDVNPYNRFDDARVSEFKRVLTVEMPPRYRDPVLDALFQEHIEAEAPFIEKQFLSIDQIVEMQRIGMAIGGHTMTHPYLSRFDGAMQRREIGRCLERLRELLPEPPRCFAYPYGSYNGSTLDLLRGEGVGGAFTTRVGTGCERDRPLEIDRLDTNDLPLEGEAVPNAWSRSVMPAQTDQQVGS